MARMLTRNAENDENDTHVTMHDAYYLLMVWNSERRSASSNSARHARLFRRLIAKVVLNMCLWSYVSKWLEHSIHYRLTD